MALFYRLAGAVQIEKQEIFPAFCNRDGEWVLFGTQLYASTNGIHFNISITAINTKL